MSHPLNRSGLGARSDLDTNEVTSILNTLDQDQKYFLSHENKFRSKEYIWPRNALWNWSRVWEYPFVYYHLNEWVKSKHPSSRPTLVDVGTGVTFFPFSAAKLGFTFIGTDIDKVCVNDLNKAKICYPDQGDHVESRLITNNSLPIDSQSADVVTCISVIEHIPDFTSTIKEIARILKPGGLFVLTIDLDLRGDSEIGQERYALLMSTLFSFFKLSCPIKTVHPADMLTTVRSPIPVRIPSGLTAMKFVIKEKLRKQLGRKPRNLLPIDLAVEGLVLEKNLTSI